jgi:deoxyadenosine/deoxycytidine kinase
MDIYVEGNIGTGKTTFLDFLKTLFSKNNHSFVYEPVDQWTNLKDSNGKNLLEHFYEDQNKWSFAFQMNSFVSRIEKIQHIEKDFPKNIKFIERSVYTDKKCFANNCYETGKMNKIEFDIYNRWHKWLCKEFKVKPSAFIYLKTTPEISLERINKRNRGGESGIPIDYLTKLDTLHNVWMDEERANGVPVLILDVSKDFYNDETEKHIIISKLKEFMETLN